MDNNVYSTTFDRLNRQAIDEGRRYFPMLTTGLVQDARGFTPSYEKRVEVDLVELAGTKEIGKIMLQNSNAIQEIYADYRTKKVLMPAIAAAYTESEFDIKNGKSSLQDITPQALDSMARGLDSFMFFQYSELSGGDAKYVKLDYDLGTGATKPSDLESAIIQTISSVKVPGKNNITLLLSSYFTDFLAGLKIHDNTGTTVLEVVEKYCGRTGVRVKTMQDALPDTGVYGAVDSTFTAMAVNWDLGINFRGLDPNFDRSVAIQEEFSVKNIFLMAPSIVQNKADKECCKLLKVTLKKT